ncbi:MAG: glycine cleavage system protein GcvH [Arenicella sp.]
MSKLLYTEEHEWLLISDKTVTIGITDYAQESLGEIVYVELPETGITCQKNEAIAAVESVKSASDIYSPVEGEVVEINEELDDSPELINESPEEKGWFFKVKIDEALDTDEFMSEADYLALLEE